MQNQFNTTFAPVYGSSKLDLSHEVKLSCKFGQLIPIQLTEVLPGDHMILNTEIIARFQALIAPMMHRVNLYTYSFFVPNRLIWSNWKYWIADQPYTKEDGRQAKSSQPVVNIDSSRWNAFTKGSLADYLGIPPCEEAPVQSLTVSMLPFRAYQCIYDEYFRNQDVEPELKHVTYSTTDEPTQEELRNFYKLQYKNWEKDYFTSAFTQPQVGDPVLIPFDLQGTLAYIEGSRAQVKPYAQYDDVDQYGSILGVESNGGLISSELDFDLNTERIDYPAASKVPLTIDVSNTLTLSGLQNAATMSDFVVARTLANFKSLEKRGGTRYIEILRSFFNVVSSDARLQRPQFLGGGKTPLVVSEVVQTSETTDTSALGDYAGRIVALGSKHGFKRHFFEEHGFVITLMTILPRTSYQQGIERFWTRNDRLDYYWPQFAHLQEQPIYEKEIFVNYKNLGTNPDLPNDNPVSNDDIFGYQARYMEYRQQYSRVAGEFRDTLAYWHMGRIFTNPPVLNKNFCSTLPSSDTFLRPFAVQDGTDYVYVQIYHNLQAIRKMPKYVYPKF